MSYEKTSYKHFEMEAEERVAEESNTAARGEKKAFKVSGTLVTWISGNNLKSVSRIRRK